jgi:thiol-disulfide isomerase/thioredoxin
MSKSRKPYLTDPVWYLDESDFTPEGELIPSLRNKPSVIFIQSLKCGWCTKAIPEFQEFANKFGGEKGIVNCFTIRCNVGSEDKPPLQQGEQNVCDKVKKLIPDFKGYPTIAGFVKGTYKETSNFPRDVDGLEKFARSL